MECPNCNSDKVKHRSFFIDLNTGREVGLYKSLIFGIILILLGTIITLSGYGIAKMGSVWWCILPYLIFGGAPLIAYGLEIIVLYARSNRKNAIKYSCEKCKWKWEQWETGWDEAKCAKCQSEKVMVRPIRVNAKTNLPFNFLRDVYLSMLIFVFTVAAVIIIIIGTRGWLIDYSVQWSILGPEVDLRALFVVGLALFFIFGSLASIYRYIRKDSLIRSDHKCAACGNTWSIAQSKN